MVTFLRHGIIVSKIRDIFKAFDTECLDIFVCYFKNKLSRMVFKKYVIVER